MTAGLGSLGAFAPPGDPFVPGAVNHVPLAVRVRNLRQAHALGLPLISVLSPHDLPLAICGGSPSLDSFVDEIRKAPIVWAVNKAHGHLKAQGVRVQGVVLVDAHPMLADQVEPVEDTIYLVASHCDPSVFEKLKGCRVVLWHDGVEPEMQQEIANLWGPSLFVHGGNTAALRALNLGRVQGFTTFRLYGMDSSFADPAKQHAYAGVPDPTGAVSISVRSTDTGRLETFRTTHGLASQAEWFRRIFREPWAWQCDIQAFGPGLIPHIAREQNRIKQACLQPSEHVHDDVISFT